MAIYLDTRGHTTLGIGLCARCSRKFPLDELMDDGNIPGLKVCAADRDDFDPYRLPARQPDRIVLPFCRPDVSIATNPYGACTEDDSYFIILENGSEYLVP